MEREAARDKLRELVATRDRLQRQILEGREELGRLEFAERQLRPRVASQDLRVASS